MALETGIPEKAREIHGYSHLLAFSDGPRTCLGRQFAIMYVLRTTGYVLSIQGLESNRADV